MIKIKLFAFLGERLGAQLPWELPETITKHALLASLADAYPELADEFLHCSVAVNQTFISDQDVFLATEINELAIIPPVSGG